MVSFDLKISKEVLLTGCVCSTGIGFASICANDEEAGYFLDLRG